MLSHGLPEPVLARKSCAFCAIFGSSDTICRKNPDEVGARIYAAKRKWHKWSVFDTGLYRPSVGRCCSTLHLCILFFCQALKLLSPGTRQIQATQYIDSPTRSQAHAGQRVLQASSGSWQHQNYSLQVKNCLDMVGAFVLVSLGCRLDGFLGTSSLQEII